MKKYIFFLVLVSTSLISVYSKASNPVISVSSEPTKSKVTSSDQNKLNLHFHFGDINTIDVKTEMGIFTELRMKGAYATNRVGEPKLLAQRKLITIPFGAEVSIHVDAYDVSTINLKESGIKYPLMPLQYDIPKSMDVSDVPFQYKDEAYNTKRFTQSEIATIEVLGVMRGVRIARVTIEPTRYNPSTNKLEIYNDIEVSVHYENPDWAVTEQIYQETYSPYFDVAYKSMMNTDDLYDEHPDLLSFPVHMLILADPMFEESLQPFIEWKTKSGFYLTVAYTDEVGSSVSDVQSWVHNQYNEGLANGHAPDFLVLVGDVQQIPASATGSSSQKKTDLYYGSVDGDYFPEMYYGRMSAQNVDQLDNMLNKIIPYEKYELNDPSYLDDVTLIAGADPTWNPRVGQATIEYGTENYFNPEHGYDDIWVYLSSYGGCYENERISVGFINYTAHCSQTSWGDPNLSISDVYNFQNFGKYPLAIGNCCLSAEFATDECIAEAWVRASGNKGAVGYIGSSPSTYWFEDFYWSVGAFPIQGNNDGYVPSYEETTTGAYDGAWGDSYYCQDALIFVGNLAVTDVDIQGYQQHSSPLYYWQAYNTMGDPSLLPYHTQGSVNAVEHMDILPIGVSQFEVSAEPGSYVAISKEGILLGTGFVDESGSVMVQIEAVGEAGDIDIVVTKQQFIPYVATIPAAALNGPYLTISDFAFGDGTQNAIFGTTASLDLNLENIGSDPASDVSITITTEDSYCTLNSPATIEVGTINADETLLLEDVFEFTINSDAPDMHTVTLNVNIEGTAKETWEEEINFNILSPMPEFGDYSIDDSFGGNNNGRLDPGENVDITIEIWNNGHAISSAGNLAISTASSYLNLTNNNIEVNSLESEAFTNVTFNLSVDVNTPAGTVAELNLNYVTGNYSVTENLQETIGLEIEDFETGDFSAFDWQFDSNPWEIVGEAEAYEGEYAARSKDISDNQISTMLLDYTVAEEGELSFWYKVSSESNYDFLKFFINGILQDEWSGEISWTQATYELSAGEYNLKWEYDKDVSLSNGDDCAWIDNVYFPSEVFNPVIISFDPVNQEVNSNESFVTEILISNVTNLGSYEFNIGFDADYLQANSVSIGDFLGSTGRQVFPLTNNIDNTNGQIDYAVTTLGPTPPGPSGNGVILNIEWTSLNVDEDVTTDLILQNLQITEPDGTIVSSVSQNGSVTINSCYSQDFDCDCDVDIVDVTMAAYAYGTSIGEPNFNPAYDLDSDEDVDIIDITMVTYDYGWSCGKTDIEKRDYQAINENVYLSWSQTRQVNDYYEMDLIIENVEQLGAFEFSFKYDAANIEILSLEEAELLGSSDRKTHIINNKIDKQEGIFSLAIASLGAQINGARGDGILATVRFKTENLNKVTFGEQIVQLVRPDAQVINHSFKTKEIKAINTGIISTYPSPLVNQLNIQYQVGEKSNISFRIYNIFGALMQTTEVIQNEIGSYSLQLDELRLSSGMYILSMEQNGRVVDSERLIVR